MKRFFAAILALMLALSLCACTSTNTENKENGEKDLPKSNIGQEEPAPSDIELPEEKGNALIELYFTVIKDLYNTDPGLNDGINLLAFDLTGVTNLTDEEKNALVYLVGREFGLQTTTGTFDELCEDGTIDKENMVFENGILFEIDSKEPDGNTFEFDASKWRSGLGAYFFVDCTAEKDGGTWSYTVGVQAIS